MIVGEQVQVFVRKRPNAAATCCHNDESRGKLTASKFHTIILTVRDEKSNLKTDCTGPIHSFEDNIPESEQRSCSTANHVRHSVISVVSRKEIGRHDTT